MKKKWLNIFIFSLAFCLLVSIPLGFGQQKKRALTLYESQESSGVIYWIELERVGKVPADYVFHTGDKIRIHLQTNFQGYVYVLAEGPSGESVILFPPPREHNALDSGTDYAVPQRGWFQFSPPAGPEKVTVILSKSRIDPFSTALGQGSSQISPSQPPQQTQTQPPSITVVQDPELDEIIEELASRALAKGRDLIYTEDIPDNNQQVCVFPADSLLENIAFTLVLNHSD
jgi:hypothetical protein